MKNIYLFSEIDSSIRETLGKNACEMIDAEPNSLGFVLTQEACAEFYITREIEKDLRGRITAVLDGLCSDAGVKFGESATVSIFASTVVPMPGILEKINGVGLNESVLSTLPDEAAQKAWALHLQLMKAFACELYVSSQHFTDLENEATGKYGVDEIEKLSVEALRELCAAFKNVYAAQGVCSLSTDPYEQFFMLLKTAFRSWDNPHACVYRRRKGITDSGLSIAVQLVDLKTGKYFKNRTTIAAADRNNKEKDASNKSEPQGEFKRIEIDGDLFEGYFLNGKKNGRGKYIWANGDVYDGMWKDGKRCGRGRISWSNGASFDGEWHDGKKHGRGTYTWADGTYYEGEFADGNFNGFGKKVYSSGDVYEGQWKDDKREGSGKYTSQQGWVYTGDFAEDEISGYGTVIFPDGGSYEGQWQNGKRNGHGKETAAGGFIYYDGEWKDNKKHGYAVYTKEGARPSPDADYSVYKCEGSFVNGRKEGRHREFLEAFVWQQSGEGYRKCKNPGEAFDDFYRDGICKASLKATAETKGYSVEEAERIATEQEARNLQNARDAEQRKKYAAIPYDGSIKTVEDARRARALADGKSSSTTPVYTNSSPAAAQDSADTAEDFEWEEFSSVGELHEKLLRPELFRDPRDRYLLNSCMYLEPFVDEFHEEFAGGDYAETKEIIAEILGVESGELTENIELRIDFIRGFTEKEYLLAAMYSLVYDERTDLAPYLANLACYLWTDTGDSDYFDPLLDLFRLSGEYDDDDSTWLCAILRLQENGNIDDPLKPNDDGSFDDQFADFDDVFGDLLDYGYLPGSDGKMYLSDSDDNGGDETEESDTGDNVLLRYQNGDSYRGAAVGGVREGFGAYFFAGGGFYRGCFHADNYEGYGMLDEGNGRVYKGLWKDDKRCGYGEQTFESGSKYFGWWKDNVCHGFGRFVFAGGSENVGEFKNGKENGIFLIKRDGKWYGYKWIDGEIIPSLDGALITYNDGSGYVGQTVTEHRRGLTVRIRQGYGEYRFPGNSRNGSTNIYQGQFSQDVPYGTGIRVDTTGEEPIILASDDFRGDSIPDGKCRAVRLTGVDSYKYALFYEGGYRDGEAFGSGMLYVAGDSENDHYRYRPYGLPIGSIVRCDHFDGGPTGAAIVTDEYGEMRYGRFVDGFWEPNK